ncbi:probable prolyl 4-hydroxylase 7 [Coccomyxa sp. Obi]|nr:probable prolyl 4-hydroxylase 7 [Coccomyxa sp. Obi]
MYGQSRSDRKGHVAWETLLVLFLCCTSGKADGSERYIEDTDRFPGWKGELPVPLMDFQGANKSDASAPPMLTIGVGANGKEEWRGEVVEVSWSPRAFLLKRFLTDAECDHLINKAKPNMVKSTVVDNDTGKSIDSTVRTSTGTFFGREEDSIIQGIERRISMITHLPEVNGEGLQILHYEDGQKYEAHHDFFHDKFNSRPENGGQRIATVLMYLTTAEEGGETVFPLAAHKVTGPQWSECARGGAAVKATRGDALLFYSLLPNGETDPTSLHGSCPTTKGEKWSATKWIHVGPFGGSAEQQRAKWGECIDADERCAAWAADGECKKNPSYMMSSCRLSCHTCTPASRSTSSA